MGREIILEWEILEHDRDPWTHDWSWVIGIIGFGVAVAVIILKNYLLGIIIGLGTFALILHGRKEAGLLRVGIFKNGVRINKEFFPYTSLHSFWIHDEEDLSRTLTFLSREKSFFPHITVPLSKEINSSFLKNILLDFLDEAYHPPSLIEALSHSLGLH